MNRWRLLALLLLLATFGSAADLAWEARTGAARVHRRGGDLTARRGEPGGGYGRLMTWQVVRTLLLAAATASLTKLARLQASTPFSLPPPSR